MKNGIFSLLLLALTLVSCSEATYEAHQSFFYPQRPEGMLLYADQTMDTTSVYSLDSWKLDAEGGWFDVTPRDLTVSVGTSLFTKLTITTTPNTTGANRAGSIVINAYHTISQRIYQSTWHNILYPFARYEEGDDDTYATRRATFSMSVAYDATEAEVRFRTYSPDATLTSDVEWMQPRQTTFAEADSYSVKLTLQPNPTDTVREGWLTLSSAGISTKIKVWQSVDPNRK